MTWQCGCGHEIVGEPDSPPFSCAVPDCPCGQCSREEPWGIAYTVGSTRVYDSIPAGTRKVGRRSAGDPDYPLGYDGGIAFRDPGVAAAWLAESGWDGFSVYRIALPSCWDDCVSPGALIDPVTKAMVSYDALLYDCVILGPA